MDEGWTRFVFDDLEIPFTTLHNKDFKGADKKKVDLRSKFDVIVFADESGAVIKNGRPGSDSDSGRGRSSSAGPPEYEGGIGKEGVDALKEFVANGGILTTLNNACSLIFNEFQSPARNALEKVNRSQFFCPTSILKLNVNTHSPIGYGMQSESAAVFSRSLAINTRFQTGDWSRTVVASFPAKDVLLSGWLLGEDMIARKAAVVDLNYKKGHIILIGIKCQHRAQTHGAYKFLLNSLLYPETE